MQKDRQRKTNTPTPDQGALALGSMNPQPVESNQLNYGAGIEAPGPYGPSATPLGNAASGGVPTGLTT